MTERRIHAHPCASMQNPMRSRGGEGRWGLDALIPEVGVGVCGDLHVIDERKVLVAVDRQADVMDGAVGELQIVVKLA